MYQTEGIGRILPPRTVDFRMIKKLRSDTTVRPHEVREINGGSCVSPLRSVGA
jgi:hypothetical protein